MELSVVVTNYKTPELLKLCLASLKDALAGIDAEVFVMDAESGEDTQFVVKEFFPNFLLIPFKKNVGFTRLVNEGLKVSGGRYILILNSDIIFRAGVAQEMMVYLSTHNDVGLIGPQLLNIDGSVQDSCRRFFGPLTILASRTWFGKTGWGRKILDRSLMHDCDHSKIQEVDWLLGSALMTRRETIERIGIMDKKFFMYLSDVDWCRRFLEAGYKIVYYPGAKLYHYHLRISNKAGGLKDLFVNRYTWIHIADAARYFWKYRFQINNNQINQT